MSPTYLDRPNVAAESANIMLRSAEICQPSTFPAIRAEDRRSRAIHAKSAPDMRITRETA